MMKKLCQLIGKYFGLIAVLFLILGMTMPQNFTWVVGKIGGIAVLSTLLGIVMFGMGTTLDLKDFALVLKRPLDVFIGACAQFLIMPGLAYVIASAFDLDPALTAGVVLVGTCPGGTSSNVITFMSKGDVALSVTMTSVSTVLSPILTPFITYKLIGERIAFDPIGMFWSIVQIVIVPICLGLAVKYFLPKLAAAATDYLPAVSGFLIQKELDFIGGALANPKRPLVAILGGSKVSSKIGVINNLLEIADTIIIGGGMSYTFRKALGGSIGDSLYEESMVEEMGKLMERAKEQGCNLLLPVDNVVADKFANDADIKVVPAGQIPDGYAGMDIGPATAEMYARIIESARTVVWNGPAGVFEMPNFAHGTETIAEAVAKVRGVSIIGGGDSAAAIAKMGYSRYVTHISTGGGASLNFLQGNVLPGIACLDDKE